MILVDKNDSRLVIEDSYLENRVMFENIITNLKLQSLKVSESLSNLKNNTNNGFGQFKNKIKERLSPNVEHNPLAQSPSTPLSTTNDLKWPVLISNEIHWVPHVPNVEEENDDIVERFTYMSNVNRSRKVRN